MILQSARKKSNMILELKLDPLKTLTSQKKKKKKLATHFPSSYPLSSIKRQIFKPLSLKIVEIPFTATSPSFPLHPPFFPPLWRGRGLEATMSVP